MTDRQILSPTQILAAMLSRHLDVLLLRAREAGEIHTPITYVLLVVEAVPQGSIGVASPLSRGHQAHVCQLAAEALDPSTDDDPGRSQ